MTDELNVSNEIKAASGTHAIDISQTNMPLDMTVRSVALTLATRHCGDTTVKEGNLYQQLKMDNKLMGPLTPEHVIHCALIFEMYLWGKWSQDIAGKAMEQTLSELDAAVKSGAFDKRVDDLSGEPPTRAHSGGDVA